VIACPHCPRELGDENAAWQHIKKKHGGKGGGKFRAVVVANKKHESFADEVVEALMLAACGEEVAEHIALMFPDEIAEARRP
jgi:hypothetical protein